MTYWLVANLSLVPTGLAALTGVVWLIRLEGRVADHDMLFREREKLTDERHDELKERLTRIEVKLDQLPRRLNNS